VLGAQVGLLNVIWTMAFLVCLSFSAWFIARFSDLTSSTDRKVKVWSVAAVITGVAFYYFIAIQPGIGFLAPASAAVKGGDETMAETVDGITWQPLNLAKLQQYRKEGKTIFVDFTAQWCLTCKANEKAVLMSKPVVDKLKALHVVTIKADWTRQDATITRLLNKFGRSGVPMYLIFSGDKPNYADVLPEVITPELVLQHLDQAGSSK
jgi:thiol:disulfide interchange protein DsbD